MLLAWYEAADESKCESGHAERVLSEVPGLEVGRKRWIDGYARQEKVLEVPRLEVDCGLCVKVAEETRPC